MSIVSVIIPTFNRPEQTQAAVKSVLGQSCRDFELIVVDDGSTERPECVQSIVESSGGKYLRTANRGVAAARNTGVERTSAKWISFLDSDDIWHPDKLKRQLEFLERHPQYRIAQARERWFRRQKFVNPRTIHRMPEGEIFSQAVKLCCISPSAVIMSRELFRSMGGFDEALTVCEDYDLWLKITAKYPVGLIDETLVDKFGGHADQLSRSQTAIDRFRVYALVKLLAAGELNCAQAEIVREEAVRRSSVIESGALKRGNAVLAQIFAAAARAMSDNAPSELNEILWRLRGVLNDARKEHNNCEKLRAGPDSGQYAGSGASAGIN